MKGKNKSKSKIQSNIKFIIEISFVDNEHS